MNDDSGPEVWVRVVRLCLRNRPRRFEISRDDPRRGAQRTRRACWAAVRRGWLVLDPRTAEGPVLAFLPGPKLQEAVPWLNAPGAQETGGEG